jgi:hypothetical protein
VHGKKAQAKNAIGNLVGIRNVERQAPVVLEMARVDRTTFDACLDCRRS